MEKTYRIRMNVSITGTVAIPDVDAAIDRVKDLESGGLPDSEYLERFLKECCWNELNPEETEYVTTDDEALLMEPMLFVEDTLTFEEE